MKFCYSRFFENNNKNNNNFGLIHKFFLMLMIIFFNLIETNNRVNFKNSLYMLDFKYYHTTEVRF